MFGQIGHLADKITSNFAALYAAKLVIYCHSRYEVLMKANTPKVPTKGAGKRLRECYEKNRNKSKASDSLLDGPKEPEKNQQKKLP